jgi:hypothetical protein
MTLFVQEAAEQDILGQAERYAEQGLPDIPCRFHAAVLDAIDALLARPDLITVVPSCTARGISAPFWPGRIWRNLSYS